MAKGILDHFVIAASIIPILFRVGGLVITVADVDAFEIADVVAARGVVNKAWGVVWILARSAGSAIGEGIGGATAWVDLAFENAWDG